MRNWFILIMVFMTGFGCAHVNSMKKSQFEYPRIDIQEQYKQYNEDYFNGKLPLEVKVSFESIPIDPNAGEIEGQSWCDDTGIGCYIQLNKKYSDAPAIYLEVLLHEMVHIELLDKPIPYGGHGRPFQIEMKRLALSDAFEELW